MLIVFPCRNRLEFTFNLAVEPLRRTSLSLTVIFSDVVTSPVPSKLKLPTVSCLVSRIISFRELVLISRLLLPLTSTVASWISIKSAVN